VAVASAPVIASCPDASSPLSPSPPAEKANARQNEAGKASISDEELMAGVQIPKIPPFTTCNFMRTCELGA
jgi:hypothetical protein